MPRNKIVNTNNVHGELGYADSVYVRNSNEIGGSVGRFFASSGLQVSGTYTNLTADVSGRQHLLIHNTTSGILYIGSSGVGTSNMLPLSGVDSSITFAVTSGVGVYGITDGFVCDVRVIESG